MIRIDNWDIRIKLVYLGIEIFASKGLHVSEYELSRYLGLVGIEKELTELEESAIIERYKKGSEEYFRLVDEYRVMDKLVNMLVVSN